MTSCACFRLDFSPVGRQHRPITRSALLETSACHGAAPGQKGTLVGEERFRLHARAHQRGRAARWRLSAVAAVQQHRLLGGVAPAAPAAAPPRWFAQPPLAAALFAYSPQRTAVVVPTS